MLTCKFENGHEVSLRHVVVDNLVLKGEEILLVKRAERLIEGGKWALAGGFVDRDETIIEAARREILEETGYAVETLTLLQIIDNPNRPNEDRQNVAFVYFCNALEKIAEPDNESDEQRWFPLNNLPPPEQIAFDHYDFIQAYLAYLAKPFLLPKIRIGEP